MTARRRAAALVVILAVVAGLAVASRNGGDHGAVEPIARSRSAPLAARGPVASATGALGSTFACPGGTAAKDGGLDTSVVVANPTDVAAKATVTVFPGAVDGEADAAAAVAALAPVSKELAVPARSRATMQLAAVQSSPYAAALVEADRGGLVVELDGDADGGQRREVIVGDVVHLRPAD
jgi:hypothetical protein